MSTSLPEFILDQFNPKSLTLAPQEGAKMELNPVWINIDSSSFIVPQFDAEWQSISIENIEQY